MFSIAFAAATWSVEAFVAPTSWLVLGWPLAAIVSGAGVLRLRPWARVLAGVLAALTLASDASGLLLDPTSTARSPLGAIEIVGSVLMLYVLLWQWPVAGRDR